MGSLIANARDVSIHIYMSIFYIYFFAIIPSFVMVLFLYMYSYINFVFHVLFSIHLSAMFIVHIVANGQYVL